MFISQSPPSHGKDHRLLGQELFGRSISPLLGTIQRIAVIFSGEFKKEERPNHINLYVYVYTTVLKI